MQRTAYLKIHFTKRPLSPIMEPMKYRNLFLFSEEMRRSAFGCFLLVILALTSGIVSAAESPAVSPEKLHRPFNPGEKLTYTISWSKIISAGTAVMEVKKEKTEDGREVFRLISTARTSGMVDSVYPVRDVVQSQFDPRTMESLSYSLNQSHGKRKKQREMVFDHEAGTVAFTENGTKEIIAITRHTLDALSSLYFLRTKRDLIVGTPIIFDIHDSGKNWSVEVHVLGRERLKTPVGEFDTIKVKTYPKYEGVFMNKGEIFIWLTDDSRKVPVLMKSTITIGSIVSTLTEMKLGDETP
jgi:hypothetical protein